MEDYIYISNNPKKGRIAISRQVFDRLAANAISRVEGITSSKKINKKDRLHRFHLNRPIETTIDHEIVHVWVAVDAAKGVNLQEASIEIQNAIKDEFLRYTEAIPFDIQVKFESIL